MRLMTAEERQELSWAKNAKIVRQGVYDVGILIGGILLAGNVAKFWPAQHPPTEVIDWVELTVLWGALGLWLGMIIRRYEDWKAIAVLEKHLDRDEDLRRDAV